MPNRPRLPSKASDIKVGVIGYGGAYNMGRAHLEATRAAGMTPTAVAELDPARLEVAANDFPGISLHKSSTAMLRGSDVNLVVIITPHNSHAPLAVECLRAGRHVVCEKPIALTTAEINRMIRAADSAGVMLSAYHNRHWDGMILQALDLVRRKRKIGDIVRIEAMFGGHSNPGDSWRGSQSISGGTLYDWGVHLLEYAFQLIDGRVTEVGGFARHGHWAAHTRWGDDTVEDEARAVIRFDTGPHLTLTVSHLADPAPDHMLSVTGTKGTLHAGMRVSKLVTFPKSGRLTAELPTPPNRHHTYYENVRDHLLGKADLIITPALAKRPVQVIEAARRSAREGRSLRLPGI